MAETNYRGHKIICSNGKDWTFDNGVPIYDNTPCSKCGKYPNSNGHDACIANLKGVKNACCGHGDIKYTYVELESGEVFRGVYAIYIIKKLKDREVLMKQFDFNKIPEILNFMEDNNLEIVSTKCGVELIIITEGSIITYSMCLNDGIRIIDDNRDMFLKRAADYFLRGDEN